MKLAQNNAKAKNTPKKAKIPKRVLMTRIMALFLCLLMIGGVVAIVLPFLGVKSFAATIEDEYLFDSAAKVRVGLMYSTGVTVGFETKAANGFNVGYVENNEFYTLMQVTDSCISVTCDSNLSKTGMSFLKTNDSHPIIGGYHVQINPRIYDITSQLAYYGELLESAGYIVFPAYVNDTIVFRIGHFGTESAANNAAAVIAPILGDEVLTIAAPSETAVSMIDPNNDIILFEFDRVSGKEFALTPIQNNDEEYTYLVTPAGNIYKGIFEYGRYISGSTDGVALTNILGFDDYVTGVLPYEIGVSWPLEVQKAFAVTVRSYTASMVEIHRHGELGFDLCNGTHCQMYIGEKDVRAITRQAVNETSAMLLTYNGNPARTYYSAVMGGVTVSAVEAWGGNVDSSYLVAIATPWEDYAGHSKGEWIVEISPKDLLNTLYNKGYKTLKGEIKDVRINKFAENSSYVYSITFTDTYGTSVTIEKSDTIRTSLSGYLNSANFVVGKAGETVTVTEYSLGTEIPIPSNNQRTQVPTETDKSDSTVTVMTADGLITIPAAERITIVKNIGSEKISDIDHLTLMTGNGKINYDMKSEMTITEPYDLIDSNDSGEINENIEYNELEINTENLPDLRNILTLPVVKNQTQVFATGTSGNFVFIGKGWGHGVGMSQHGAKNLAELGYDYETILMAYFPNTEIQKYD